MRINIGKVNEAEFSIQWNNGSQFDFNKCVRNLMRYQDVHLWQSDKVNFNDWIAGEMAKVMRDLEWRVKPISPVQVSANLVETL